jgi:CCR4-NOT transcription complex subunit 6
MKQLLEKHTSITSDLSSYISKKPLCVFKPGLLYNKKKLVPSNLIENQTDLKKIDLIEHSHNYGLNLKNKVDELNGFSIMTWNVLANGYSHPGMYSYVKSEYMRESRRFDIAIYDILFHYCDLILLQEVEKRIYEKLSSLLEGEYVCSFQKRPGLTCDGLTLMYKQSLFKQVEYNFIDLNYISDFVRNNLTSPLAEILKKIRLSHNIAQSVLLEPLSETLRSKLDYLLVVNLHLHWDPSKEIIKFIQIYHILEKIRETYKDYKRKGKKIAVLLAGDFNSLPQSKVLKLIENKFDYKDIGYDHLPFYKSLHDNLFSEDANNSTFFSDFSLHNSHEDNLYFTNIKPEFRATLDYIFYSNEDFYSNLDVSYYDSQYFMQESAIPNSFHISDHVWVISKFNV